MATDPFPAGRRSDLQSMSQDILEIRQALNLGGAARNQNKGNVPARYQVFPLRSLAVSFASLPAPSDAGVGARAIITDVTDDEFAVGWGGTVTLGTGTNKSPVWSNGDNWVIG